LRAHYRGDAFEEGAGGAPDAETANDLHSSGLYDATNLTQSQQPHSGDVLGFPALEFSKAAARGLTASGVAMNAINDDMTTMCVFKRNSAIAGTEVAFQAGVSGFNDGINIFFGVSQGLRVRFGTAASLETIDTAFSDTAAYHVVRGTTNAAGVTSSLDGAATLDAGTFNGIAAACTDIDLGRSVAGSSPGDVTIAEAVVMVNPTAAQVSGVEDFLIAKYGV
jgi:hypothetical protein|tara:strand:+ start:2562 stop:3227 length:666 start_codon:yes stop_codon:yes gene_type:complete